MYASSGIIASVTHGRWVRILLNDQRLRPGLGQFREVLHGRNPPWSCDQGVILRVDKPPYRGFPTDSQGRVLRRLQPSVNNRPVDN